MLGLRCSCQTALILLALRNKKMATKTSLMESSINTIIDTFHKYSTKEGHPDTLTKKEFKEMVKNELGTLLKKEKRKDALINDILEDLDTNQDSTLSFEEFFVLIAKLIFATHEKLHDEKHPRGQGHSHGTGFGK